MTGYNRSAMALEEQADLETPEPPEAQSLEDGIVALAESGELAKAAGQAIRHQKELGIAVTFQRGDDVIKQHADGTEEVLAKVERPTYTIPTGVRIIKNQ